MNYIKEMNAFYYHIELNPLSSSAVCLWHALLHMNNRSGWKKNFTVAASVLRTKSSLTASSFQRAREELQQKGYIFFKSRGGNQSAVYQLISLSSIMEHNKEDNTNGSMKDSLGESTKHNAGTLIKQNETKEKQNKLTTTTDALRFYEENFGMIRPYMTEELLAWVNDLGEALVLEAMKKALKQNKANWGYVQGILKAWVQKGITSVGQAKTEETAFQNKQQRKQSVSYQPKKLEVVPDWFKEREQKQKQPAAVKEASAEEQKDIVRLLAKYGDGG